MPAPAIHIHTSAVQRARVATGSGSPAVNQPLRCPSRMPNNVLPLRPSPVMCNTLIGEAGSDVGSTSRGLARSTCRGTTIVLCRGLDNLREGRAITRHKQARRRHDLPTTGIHERSLANARKGAKGAGPVRGDRGKASPGALAELERSGVLLGSLFGQLVHSLGVHALDIQVFRFVASAMSVVWRASVVPTSR